MILDSARLTGLPVGAIVDVILVGRKYYVYLARIPPIGIELECTSIEYAMTRFLVWDIWEGDENIGFLVKAASRTRATPIFLMSASPAWDQYTLDDVMKAKEPVKLMYTFEYFSFYDYSGLLTLIVAHTNPHIKQLLVGS